ncbi:aspartyl/asparaginyl beta-hydroxylase domain-containing protein [Kribbella sp. NPDC058245]|uniref:aspartyl/asparaginyl beta-hydroxylase domain-containing protein n=1 Tax=Kribbella sp. NPDC058245 TaxID=3346399 RepID=UPI0036EE5997
MTVTLDQRTETAREAARFLQQYSKRYAAGAFATPTAKELAASPQMVRDWRAGEHRTLGVVKVLGRDSKRKDFTGREFLLPKGASVITHLARTPGAPVPDFDRFDYVMGYVEDTELAAGLASQGRPLKTWRITSASEVIGVWSRPGDIDGLAAADLMTVTSLPGFTVAPSDQQAILAELDSVNQWHDDFPYYSDGSWSAVSLRGFKTDDPRWGIKPSEMPRSWQNEHPESAAYRCDWTVLADQTPCIRELVESVDWWDRLERVRLLRMAGRGGKGGKLGRHTDITDRNAGTRDGQIVRFHIPLITNPAIKMHSWNLSGREIATHLQPWRCYYLDARKPHAVVNPTGVDRVHLVVDVVSSPKVRAAIAGSTPCDA